MPPETTANCGLVSEATIAASMSPSRGPLVTTRMWIDITRPRSWSGVSSWTSDDRKTAEKTSAAPAAARHRRASGNETVTSPNAVIANPQTATARRIARPVRWTLLTQPEKRAPTNAPAAGAAARKPSPAGPVWKVSRARTGKSDVGIPKIIALRSITNEPRIARRRRAKRRPSRIASSPGRVTAPSGGSGWIASSATNDAMNDTRSTAYAPASPIVAMRMPPMAGPTIEASWKLSWLSAMADGNRSGGTRRGIDDERAGWSTADSPAATNGDREQRDERWRTRQREKDEGEAAGSESRLGRHQQPSPVDGVRERPGTEREEQDRHQLEEGQRRDRQRRAGQDVDLVRQGDPGDLVADAVDDLAGPQPAIVAIASEWLGVEEDAPEAARGARLRRGQASTPADASGTTREIDHAAGACARATRNGSGRRASRSRPRRRAARRHRSA